MKVTKQIHKGHQEIQEALARDPDLKMSHIFCKWQYIYETEEATISLIHFTPHIYGKWCWEIYQLTGTKQVLGDIERFRTKKEAVNAIKKYLG